MTIKEAISIITKCASVYEENLCNRQVAFLYRNSENKAEIIEVIFRANNFFHFTGVDTLNHQKAGSFYRDALDHRLSETNLVFKDDFTTEAKLKVLPSIMNIPYTARMVGDYIGPHLELFTEKVTGTTSACLGLIRNKSEYIPNSVLSEDIRQIVPYPPGKIFAILRKKYKDPLYTELTYQSKNIIITSKCIPEDFKKQISLDLHL